MLPLNEYFLNSRLYKKKYGTLTEGVNHLLGRNINLIMTLKKIIFMFSLIMLYD